MDTRVRGIPTELWREFKAMCALQGKSMNAVLVKLVQQAVDEWKKGGDRK